MLLSKTCRFRRTALLTILEDVPELTQDLVDLDMYFQQDSASCYTARETIQIRHETFPGCVRSCFDDYNCPPRSCDLTLYGVI